MWPGHGAGARLRAMGWASPPLIRRSLGEDGWGREKQRDRRSPRRPLGGRYFFASDFLVSDLFSGFFSDTSVHSYLVSVFSPQRRAAPTLVVASPAGPTFWVDFLQQVISCR